MTIEEKTIKLKISLKNFSWEIFKKFLFDFTVRRVWFLIFSLIVCGGIYYSLKDFYLIITIIVLLLIALVIIFYLLPDFCLSLLITIIFAVWSPKGEITINENGIKIDYFFSKGFISWDNFISCEIKEIDWNKYICITVKDLNHYNELKNKHTFKNKSIFNSNSINKFSEWLGKLIQEKYKEVRFDNGIWIYSYWFKKPDEFVQMLNKYQKDWLANEKVDLKEI